MFYCVYKVTNKVNDKIYIGAHKTSNLTDNYLGSGLLLKRAIAKYGRENFTKEMLHVYDNESDMLTKEKELVNPTFIQLENTYNINEGGHGSFSYINSLPNQNHKPGQRRLASLQALHKFNTDLDFRKRRLEQMSNFMKYRNRVYGTYFTSPQFVNPAPHRNWISNDILQKSIFVPKLELDQYLTKGWFLGRKYKVYNTGKKYKKRNKFFSGEV